MEKSEFARIAMALKTYYSKEEKLLPNNQAMELWFRQLQDIPYEVAEEAVNKWVTTNKWSPSIADIREMASSIVHGDIPDWGSGWNAVQMAIRRFGVYNPQEAMESLDGVTRQCVERLGFRELCLSENPEMDRANFRKLYEVLADKKKMQEQIPYDLQRLIAETHRKLEGGSDLLRIGDIRE